MQQIELLPFNKRWKARTERWVSQHDRFEPKRFGVEVIRDRIAKPFVSEHHYSGTYPATRLAVGLFRQAGYHRELCGVAIFSVGIQPRSIPAYTGLPYDHGVELGRFVLLDDTGFSSESWFLKRAFQALRASLPDVDVVLSYADPLERRDPVTTAITKPSHWGTIYQASNAIFCGRSKPGTVLFAPDGTTLSRRAICKIRFNEVGRDYALEQLLHAGIPRPPLHTDLAAWIQSLYEDGIIKRQRHPGSLAYVFGLNAAAKAQVLKHNAGGLPYPKAQQAA